MSCSDERRGLNQKRGMRKTERGRRWRRQKQGIRRLKSTAVDFKILKCFQGTKKPPGKGRRREIRMMSGREFYLYKEGLFHKHRTDVM